MSQAIIHIALVVRDYDEAIAYGNRWDLVEFTPEHPLAQR